MLWLAIALALTFALVATARWVARRRGRDPFAWGLASALFPPALLLLPALPRRGQAAQPS